MTLENSSILWTSNEDVSNARILFTENYVPKVYL